MTRELINRISQEFTRIDSYLGKFAEKYGRIFYGDMEYIRDGLPEKIATDCGEIVYTGTCYCTDEVTVAENCEDAEDLDEVEINVGVFTYEEDAEQNVTAMRLLGSQRWSERGVLGV